jgi:hypothetical protein
MYGLASSAARIAGPSLAGILIALTGPATVLAVDAATYGVSVLALSRLTLPRAARPADRGSLLQDMADGWQELRSRTWLWVTTLQFAFFNLITWAPWMLLGQVMGHAYLGAAAWGAILAAQGAGVMVGGLCCLGRRPSRPLVVATIAMFLYALPDTSMAMHAAAPWVAATAFACGVGSAVALTFYSAAQQQQVPADMQARISALTTFPNFGIGVLGYVIDGPLSAAIGVTAVFGIGAVYGVLSAAAVLAFPSIRAVRWQEGPGHAGIGVSAPAPAPPMQPNSTDFEICLDKTLTRDTS